MHHYLRWIRIWLAYSLWHIFSVHFSLFSNFIASTGLKCFVLWDSKKVLQENLLLREWSSSSLTVTCVFACCVCLCCRFVTRAATCVWRVSTLCRGARSDWRTVWRDGARWAGAMGRWATKYSSINKYPCSLNVSLEFKSKFGVRLIMNGLQEKLMQKT